MHAPVGVCTVHMATLLDDWTFRLFHVSKNRRLNNDHTWDGVRRVELGLTCPNLGFLTNRYYNDANVYVDFGRRRNRLAKSWFGVLRPYVHSYYDLGSDTDIIV